MSRVSSIAERISAEDSYGVFVWSLDGRYPAKNAVKVFKSRVLAQRFADKNIDRNYVVRTIWNPAAHGEDRQMTHWNASIAERIASISSVAPSPAFVAITLPLRKRLSYGDQVCFLGSNGRGHVGVLTGMVKSDGFQLTMSDGEKIHIPVEHLRMPKGGFRVRDSASRWVKFDDLPRETQTDIASEIEERFGVYRPIDDLRGLVNPPVFLVRDTPIRSITGYNRNPSQLAVGKYVEMLERGSEAPPILVDGNKFVDGGHRFAAYVQAGRKTIPTIDVGRIFKLWPEWEAGRADELERMAGARMAGVPKGIVLLHEGDGFNVRGINNRRFMYNPKTSEILFGGSDVGRSSHAQEWYDAGAKGNFDDCVRGWIGYGGKYKDGIIHFAPEVTSSRFSEGYDALDMFRRHGAAGKTIVRNFVKMIEQPMDEIFNPSREKVATRPIRIDRRVAQESVSRLVADLKDSYFGRHTDERIGDRRYAFIDHVTIQDVDGNDIRIQVQYRFKSSSSGDLVLGGGSGKVTTTQEPAIVIEINGIYTADVFYTTTSGERFFDEAVSVLMHELTHQADIYTKSVLTKTQRVPTEKEIDLVKYYNSPAEIHSYMREVFEEIYRHLPVFLKHFPSNEAVTRLTKLSPTWQRIQGHLTDRNRGIMLKGIYQAVQDYIAEQGLQKAASEVAKVEKQLV